MKVLDEAQMVENKSNRPSQMVKLFNTRFRWATTGTPIEKDSLRCLYGLLFFLDFEPYTNEKVFNVLWNDYRTGHHSEMIKTLAQIMWRTCKKNVESEINIPKQREVIHQVEMSDLQKYFYNQAVIVTRPLFEKNMKDFLVRNGTYNSVLKKREIDPSMKNKFLYELNNATLRCFLEPLRNLRQDCTIPNVFQNSNSNDQARVKQTLRPEQLHEHLISKTSIETKSALRTIVSSINGIAALKIAEEKLDESISLYQQVLKLANEYTGFVTVDSMLLIHVYNSLIEVAAMSGKNLPVEEYRIEMNKFEWKYISNYYEKVLAINRDMECLRPGGDDTFEVKWWQDIIYACRSSDEERRLIDIINLEVFSVIFINSQIVDQVRSIRGVHLIITEWFDKIKKLSKDVKKRFKSLNFIVENLRQSSEMSNEDNEKVIRLATEALACHLNILENEEDEDNAAARNKKGHCELCKLKMKLNEYECVLFNKTLMDDNNVEGSWNPRFEEKVLKSIHIFAKRFDFEDETISEGNKFFKSFDALKEEFKLLAKLWVEVNYTISAFDELNMCKMRLQVVDSPEELAEEDSKFRLKIARYETDEQLQEYQSQRLDAEINFVRLNGRLKYLLHLKERNEPQSCPICCSVPREKYYITICGHLICGK